MCVRVYGNCRKLSRSRNPLKRVQAEAIAHAEEVGKPGRKDDAVEAAVLQSVMMIIVQA